MINSLEANVGDCCYFLIKNEKKIKFGTIVGLHLGESAVQVMEALDSKFHTIWEQNAAWEEKELKGKKWLKPHNYIRTVPQEIIDEKESNKRVSVVHNRTKPKRKSRRTKRKS